MELGGNDCITHWHEGHQAILAVAIISTSAFLLFSLRVTYKRNAPLITAIAIAAIPLCFSVPFFISDDVACMMPSGAYSRFNSVALTSLVLMVLSFSLGFIPTTFTPYGAEGGSAPLPPELQAIASRASKRWDYGEWDQVAVIEKPPKPAQASTKHDSQAAKDSQPVQPAAVPYPSTHVRANDLYYPMTPAVDEFSATEDSLPVRSAAVSNVSTPVTATDLYYSIAPTPKEAEQVAAMKCALNPDLAGLACAEWPDVTGDLRLLRFIQGYNHNLDKATAAVRDMLVMRKLHNCDSLHQRWAPTPCDHLQDFPHQAHVQDCMPSYGTIGVSREGHAVCYNPIGRHDFRRLLQKPRGEDGLEAPLGEAGFLEFYVAQCESRMHQLHVLSLQHNVMAKILMIVDLQDVSLWHLTAPCWSTFNRRYMDRINRSMAEGVARAYVINSPRWLVAMYRRLIAGSRWLPKKTQEKLQFFGGPDDYEPQLSKHLDAKTLAELHKYMDEARELDGRLERR